MRGAHLQGDEFLYHHRARWHVASEEIISSKSYPPEFPEGLLDLPGC
jgi:hypothetical protein